VSLGDGVDASGVSVEAATPCVKHKRRGWRDTRDFTGTPVWWIEILQGSDVGTF